MIIASFNLNGIRSASRKGFFEWLESRPDIDVLCLQELKAGSPELGEFELRLAGMGFAHVQWHCAVKKGYSGTALCARHAPDASGFGFGEPEFDDEGRLCWAHFGSLDICSAYFPSGSAGEHRQASKLRFLSAFAPWLAQLRARGARPLVCADLNIAHTDLDLKNWKGNVEAPGCTSAERAWMDRWLAAGWIDVGRALRPGDPYYTWWSQRGGSRARDVGWRIDAQICGPELAAAALDARVEREPVFSDHAPLLVEYAGGFASWRSPIPAPSIVH